MKTKFYFLLIIAFSLVFKSALFAQNYSGGAGTPGDPYQIANKADLKYLSENNGEWSKDFIQTADITFVASDFQSGGDFYNSGNGFRSIGNFYENFSGSYDGRNHLISNLEIISYSFYEVGWGFFGVIHGATISNVNLVDANVVGYEMVGILVGYVKAGTVLNSSASGSVTADGFGSIGVLIGENDGIVSTCHANGSILNGITSGGLIGINSNNGVVSDCYATINGDFNGGLIGSNSGSVSKSYATGTLTSLNDNRGGLIGGNTGSVTNCYASVDVSGDERVGGLIGVMDEGTVSYCHASGSVSGNASTGGLIGFFAGGGTVINCYATGNISTNGGMSASSIGGLIGQCIDGTVTNCYAKGEVSGEFAVGGLIGFFGYYDPDSFSPLVSNSYAIGNVTCSNSTKGGLIGYFTSYGTITNCFYDSQTTGQSDTGKGDPKTTVEMQTQSTFTTWNFTDIWSIGDCNVDGTYPKLRWEIFSGGAGTVGDPFLIAKLDDLQKLSENSCLWNKHFKQTANIDASATSTWNSGAGFSPIGNSSTNFTGLYNGQGFEIVDLTITRPTEDYMGLFGYNNGDLRKIHVKETNITGQYRIGAIVGYNEGTISECISFGTLVGTGNVGGLCGENDGNITNCYTGATVNGASLIGGFIGYNGHSGGEITHCYSFGSVTGTSDVGGFCGSDDGDIFDCFYDEIASTQNDTGKGDPKTAAEMITQSTFTDAGWDFSTTPIWKMGICSNEGYPVFTWQTIQTRPTISNPVLDSRCGTGTVDLGATASAGDVNWYDASSGGTLVGTGITLTTPSISSTSTYYAEADDAGCLSASRTAVTASVYDCSELTAGWCGEAVAGITNTVNFEPVASATEYEVWVQGPSAYSQTVSRPNTKFKLSMFTGILYNTSYTVRVRAKVGGNWTPYGSSCNLSTPAVPGNTKLVPSDCGITLTASDQVLNYNEIYGATDYEIWVEGPNSYSSMLPRNNNSTSFRLSWFSGIKLQTTYTVKVRAFVNGTWGAWAGMACDVTTPPIPLTQLVAGNCGHTLTTPDEILNYEAIQGASNYEIWIQGPSSYSQTMERNNNKTTFRLSWFSGLTTNTTYSVQVRSYVNGIWSAWGSACDVTTMGSLSLMQNNTPEAFDESVSLEDVSIEAYPNPTKGEFTISSSHEGTFRIVNELGQLVQTLEISKENNFEVKVDKLDAGVYFVTGTIKGNVVTKKVMVM